MITVFHTRLENFSASTTNTETQARGTILLHSFNFLIWLSSSDQTTFNTPLIPLFYTFTS